MSDVSTLIADLPPEQQSIRAKCVHASNSFVKFEKEEIEQSVPDRFEQQVAKYPDRIAVKSRNHALTYDGLNKAANRVARAILAQRGEGNEPIALLLENHAPMTAAFLGILKAGKIYLPLDASLPNARVAYILEDSQAGLIVTNSENLSLAKRLARSELQLLNIDKIDSSVPDEGLGIRLLPDALAYILYTSGSTGHPKGVVNNHRNLLHDIMTRTNAFHICAHDRLTLLTSVAMGRATKNMLGALLNGAALYPLDVKKEGVAHLGDWLMHEEITIFDSGSSLFRHFAAALPEKEKFPLLRLIRVGGEPVLVRDVELYKTHFSATCIFINALSTTETGAVREYFIDQKTRIIGNVVPVGYPVEDNEVLLLDDNGEEVGFNAIGEIAIKGRYLSLGYWRRPDLTQAAFLPDREGGGKRIYRTGDLGRLLPNGCLVHLGRKDFQVKVRGYRIEINEVENALNDLDTIKDAVVVAREERPGDQRLIAYVVPAQRQAPTTSEIRRFLKAKLPEYMVPSAFVFLDALPRAPNGKVDRRALPTPDQTRPRLETAFVTPKNAMEVQLTKILEKILSIQPVGVKDNFFDLGGHSLLAVRLVAEIGKTFGKQLPVATLFQAPTVEHLARILRQESGPAPASSLVVCQPGGSKPPFFCVHGYNSYFHLARYLGPDQPFYGLAQHLNGKQIHHTRIEEIAAHYLEEIRGLQPEGPYFLGGHSMGGMVAFEMAQQLKRQGQEVALLALIDPTSLGNSRLPAGRTSSLPKLTLLRSTFSRHLRNLTALGLKGRLTYVLERVQERIKRRFNTVSCKVYHFLGVPLPPDLQTFYVEEIVYGTIYPKARRAYVPQVYSGRVIIFKAEGSFYNPQLDGVTGRLEIHAVPGDHQSILVEPHIQVWAEQLKVCLQSAQHEVVEA